MDFLEKIGYTDSRKRLRKRFTHYSETFTSSQPHFIKAFQSVAGTWEKVVKTIADGSLEHVKHLAVEIGSRPIGSPANHAAADYISQVFKKSGLSVERQEIQC